VILLGTEGEKIGGTGVGDAEEETGKSAEGGFDMERGRMIVGAVDAADGT
jgi:hypothetical protein